MAENGALTIHKDLCAAIVYFKIKNGIISFVMCNASRLCSMYRCTRGRICQLLYLISRFISRFTSRFFLDMVETVCSSLLASETVTAANQKFALEIFRSQFRHWCDEEVCFKALLSIFDISNSVVWWDYSAVKGTKVTGTKVQSQTLWLTCLSV